MTRAIIPDMTSRQTESEHDSQCHSVLDIVNSVSLHLVRCRVTSDLITVFPRLLMSGPMLRVSLSLIDLVSLHARLLMLAVTLCPLLVSGPHLYTGVKCSHGIIKW